MLGSGNRCFLNAIREIYCQQRVVARAVDALITRLSFCSKSQTKSARWNFLKNAGDSTEIGCGCNTLFLLQNCCAANDYKLRVSALKCLRANKIARYFLLSKRPKSAPGANGGTKISHGRGRRHGTLVIRAKSGGGKNGTRTKDQTTIAVRGCPRAC